MLEPRARRRCVVKLLRSIMTKGMESLAVECLVAANAMGLRASLYEVLSDIDRTPLTTFMDAFVRSHVDHAGRRHAEVREARDQLHEAGLEPLVLDGVERLFARTARHLEAARAQGGVEVDSGPRAAGLAGAAGPPALKTLRTEFRPQRAPRY